jgi:hypothetical protein
MTGWPRGMNPQERSAVLRSGPVQVQVRYNRSTCVASALGGIVSGSVASGPVRLKADTTASDVVSGFSRTSAFQPDR